MASVISNFLGNALLQRYFRDQQCWLSLHNADPTVLGSSANELFGGDYEREQIDFSAPSAKTIANSARIRFDNLPAATVTYFGIWNAEVGGSMLSSILIPGGLSVPDSARLVIPIGDVAVSV